MTTYEYIVRKRQKRSDKEKRQAEEAKRAEAERAKAQEVENGIGNDAFDENPDRIKSAATVITVNDVGMKS